VQFLQTGGYLIFGGVNLGRVDVVVEVDVVVVDVDVVVVYVVDVTTPANVVEVDVVDVVVKVVDVVVVVLILIFAKSNSLKSALVSSLLCRRHPHTIANIKMQVIVLFHFFDVIFKFFIRNYEVRGVILCHAHVMIFNRLTTLAFDVVAQFV